MLLAIVEKEGKMPKKSDVVNGVNIGSFWHSILSGANQDIYHNILSHNPLLKEKYDSIQKGKEEKKGKVLLTPEEKAKRLLLFVEKEGRVPKQSEIIDGIKFGSYWDSVKGGANQKLYQSLLSTNPLLKADYERVQLLKQKKSAE